MRAAEVIARQKPKINKVINVVEKDEMPLALWLGYWQDVGEHQLIVPSHDVTDTEVVAKITPPAFMRQ